MKEIENDDAQNETRFKRMNQIIIRSREDDSSSHQWYQTLNKKKQEKRMKHRANDQWICTKENECRRRWTISSDDTNMWDWFIQDIFNIRSEERSDDVRELFESAIITSILLL